MAYLQFPFLPQAFARHLINNDPGILAGPDALSYLLMRRMAALIGDVPLRGQAGKFEIAVDGTRIHVKTGGLLGVRRGRWIRGAAVEVPPVPQGEWQALTQDNVDSA